ncbi:NAD(P)-dependent oxidoreductase [Nonomuraea gerenzanensis]|uniref:Flavin reductase n=1 Tax=Nonomuraea gerenzanensis TaxID=93944 RepID=A0A1M4DVM8_9ACTN|nr:SDR family oxidoreductase [Nonomuraea gerenzanensis]UBU12995.1 SDR family oxidoreductase [Nonomuraea gerenzanensis]SBO90634.1 Flavin reductase [Nonomuraea gerenzanensis]
MKLVIFGANGPTGRLTTAQALAEGHFVTAVTRHPETFPLSGAALRVARADALDPEAVDRVVAGHDAVISTLGVPYGSEAPTTFSESAEHIVAAMTAHGIRRLVCVTSTGVPMKPPPGETLLYRKVVVPMLLKMGRPLYEDAGRMEEIVAGSGLDWTVIRPSGLFDGDRVTRYTVGAPQMVGRFTSRRDLADALIREAVEGRNLRSVVEVITTEGTPSVYRVFLKEALRIGGAH